MQLYVYSIRLYILYSCDLSEIMSTLVGANVVVARGAEVIRAARTIRAVQAAGAGPQAASKAK